MRAYKRTESLDGDPDVALAEAVGIDPADMELMFRQVAIGDYDDRYVIPKAHPEAGDIDPNTLQGSCGLEWVDREIGPGAEHFDLRDHITHVDGDGR
jgi:nitrate reductase beta subunit